MGSAHVPVEVFGLEVRREHIGKELPQVIGNACHRVVAGV